jgi:hypothetical protein
MALSTDPVFVQLPKIGPAAFTNTDAANTKKTVVTAGGNGGKLFGLSVTSTDTTARVAQVWLTRGATSYLLTAVSIPALSGTDGTTPNIDLLNNTQWPGLPYDGNAQNFVLLQGGDLIQVSLTTQVAAGKEVDAVAIWADY